MDQNPFIIVGASLTGANAAAQLRKDGFEGRIVLIGDEPHRPYERPPLSKEYLRGDPGADIPFVHGPAFYDDGAIELRTATTVTAIDPGVREVVLGDGSRLGYERLLLATGVAARTLDIPGHDLAGVHHLRTLEDADAIREAAGSAGRAVVIGGGWVGAEVAASLRQLGLEVTLVGPGSAPLERVLGPEVGAIYRDLHAAHGVRLEMGRRVDAIRGTERVESVLLSDGTSVAADLVVAGIGAQPRTTLAAAAGLRIEQGIAVDEHLETSVPGIFAAGDVAAAWHPGLGARIRVEHWDNARRQGRAAAKAMMGATDPYVRQPYFYSDQYDLSMEYVGYAVAWDRVVLRGDPAAGSFVAFWLRDGRVVAGMNANVPKVNGAIGAIIGSGRPAIVAALADPSIPLTELDALVAPA